MHADRPILINSWQAAYFDFTGDTIVNLAKQASELGIDMIVMDDGWFGKRNDDNSSLGDWTVNEEKLGGSKDLTGGDIPVYLDSSPEETKARRIRRGRDENAASDFIQLVVALEQKKLLRQAEHAAITLGKDGQIYESEINA